MGRGHGRREGALRPEKLGSLAVLLERYGEAIRPDLRRYYNGFSLTQMFSGEVSPDEVWEMILHLPRTSATTAARLADPATVFSDDEDAEPPWEDWSPEAQRLDDITDLLSVISEQIAKFGTGKRIKIDPRKRPGDAIRKRLKAERSAQARREWSELLKQMGVPE